jgi:hypothetical protein
MTKMHKVIIGTTLVLAIGTGYYEGRQAGRLQRESLLIQQQESSLSQHAQQLTQENNEAARQLSAIRTENERLDRTTSELLKLRAEVAQFRNVLQSAPTLRDEAGNQTTGLDAQVWTDRVKTLKRRLEEWPGKKTPELQLLNEKDWLDEAAFHELDSETSCRQSMSRLRTAAKRKFAGAVNEAIDQYAKSNNGQLPADLSELQPYLAHPIDSFLGGYQIAKPGWLHPPEPGGPNSERAATWAIIENGSFTPDGVSLGDTSLLPDPEYDMYHVIFQGGWYAYGAPHIATPGRH